MNTVLEDINGKIQESDRLLNGYGLQIKTKNDLFRMYDEQIKFLQNDVSEQFAEINNGSDNSSLLELSKKQKEEAVNEIRRLKEKTVPERARNMELRKKGKEYSDKLQILNDNFHFGKLIPKSSLLTLTGGKRHLALMK